MNEMIEPEPVPTQVRTGALGDHVLLSVLTPVGQAVYFLDPDIIDSVIEGLSRAKAAATSGLIVPELKVVPPDET